MADNLRDRNPQKDRLLQAWLTLAAQSKNLLVHAAVMDRLESNNLSFGSAIEHVYAPDDPQHTHPLGMVTLAALAFEWIEGRAKAPEWVRHAGIVE